MNRPLAFVFALIFALRDRFLGLHRRIPPTGSASRSSRHQAIRRQIQASFREQRDDRDDNNWSTGFMPSDLIGLECPPFVLPARGRFASP